MFYNIWLILVVFVTGAITLCPPSNLLTPCKCVIDDISCDGNIQLDLSTIFEALSKSQNQKHFKQFYLSNTYIKELKANTFSRITFEQILIHSCYNLTSIDKNAFNGTDLVTDFIYIHNNPKLSSPDNSIFEVLSKFKNASSILITSNGIRAIPSNAFTTTTSGHQNRLKSLTLSGKNFHEIGEKAFYKLKSLTYLQIDSTQIEFIPENAFAFEDNSDKPLELYIYYNKFIENYNISQKAFMSLKRPTHLYIDFDNHYNVHYLEEKAFLPFLLQNKVNKLFTAQLLDCNDCRNVWLKKNPDILNRIDVIKCSNNKSINDQANFKNCNVLLK